MKFFNQIKRKSSYLFSAYTIKASSEQCRHRKYSLLNQSSTKIIRDSLYSFNTSYERYLESMQR